MKAHEGSDLATMTWQIDHPLLSRIDGVLVETHERQDPARYVPVFETPQNSAERIIKPHINRYWVWAQLFGWMRCSLKAKTYSGRRP